MKNQFLGILGNVKNTPLKYLLLITILGGLFIGFLINNSINEPKINNLIATNEESKKEINLLLGNISIIQNNYQTLEKNYISLSGLYEDTLNTHIPLEDYNLLQEEYLLLTENYKMQNVTIENLIIEKKSLTNLNIELIKDYNNLIKKYNKIKTLSWVYFVIDGMEINLTTIKNSYTELEDITGTLSIRENDEPFKGQIEFRVWSDLQIAGTSGFSHDINEFIEYSIHNGFIFGPGQYTLGLSKIIDHEGNIIATIDELKEYKISIEMG
jgi:hypothetical protein